MGKPQSILGAGMVSTLDFVFASCSYFSQKYPNSKITGLSNSSTQKAYITSTAKERQLSNIDIITADVNTFDFDGSQQ